MFITIDELKQTVLNANLDELYIQPAINEAEDVYLREILGDALYNVLVNKINGNTLTGKYQTLVNSYIKPYLTYKVQSILVVPINFKMRNAGVVNQYDNGFSTTTVKDTAYLAEHYDGRAEFYANRLITYLKQNAVDFPEYGYSVDNVTNPTDSQNVTTLYLGGTRKKCNCLNITGGGGGTADTVDWDNITNRPNFATVATSGDYTDLLNTPDLSGYVDTATYNQQMQNIDNALGDKVDVDTYNNRMTDIDNALGNKVNTGDYNQQMQNIDNALAEKVETTALCTINNERLDTRGNFELVKVEDIATVATTGDYGDLLNLPTIPAAQIQADWDESDSSSMAYINNKPTIPAAQVQADWQQNDSSAVDYIKNKPSMPSAQIQSDWNQTNSSEVDYIKNKPTIPVVPTNVSAFTNDAGYLTQHQSLAGYATENWVQQQGYSTFDGDYNSLTNKPSIPAAQVNSDWTSNSGVSQILNKPTMTSETWTFTVDDGQGGTTTVTKKVWLEQ